jgi:hypothetical protein
MDALIPCLGVVAALFIIFGFLAFLRYMNYKETIVLAEKGLTRAENKSAGKGLLRWGIIVTAVGFALALGLYPIGFSAGADYPLHLGPWMLGGFVPIFLGIALMLIYYLTEKG